MVPDSDKHFKRKLRRNFLTAFLLLLVCGYASLLFTVNRAMHESPEQFGKLMSRMPMPIFLIVPFETMWTHARAGTLNVGDHAPDFSLTTLDKTAKLSLASIRNNKPVVLVFGSYT
jgi:hypothetical protein